MKGVDFLRKSTLCSPGPAQTCRDSAVGSAKPALAPSGVELLPGGSNYFIGNDSSLWRSAVPAYAKVRFSGVYDGVDLVYYGNQQQLEYDFVIAPHADPPPIQLHFAGATSQHLDTAGNLAIVASGGEVVFHKPVIYQLEDGRRRAIPGAFKLLADNSVGFRVGRYNHAQPLIIDPTLVYSTYLGGSNFDMMNAIAVDSNGEAFLTGTTASTDYPVTTGAYQTEIQHRLCHQVECHWNRNSLLNIPGWQRQLLGRRHRPGHRRG